MSPSLSLILADRVHLMAFLKSESFYTFLVFLVARFILFFSVAFYSCPRVTSWCLFSPQIFLPKFALNLDNSLTAVKNPHRISVCFFFFFEVMLNHGIVEDMKTPWKQQLTFFWLFHRKPAKHCVLSQGRKHHPCSAGLKDQEKGSTEPGPKVTNSNVLLGTFKRSVLCCYRWLYATNSKVSLQTKRIMPAQELFYFDIIHEFRCAVGKSYWDISIRTLLLTLVISRAPSSCLQVFQSAG